MNQHFILYKITTVPAGAHFIKYAKKINCNKIAYTRNKSEAKVLGIVPAFFYAVMYGLSTKGCHLVNPKQAVKTGSTRFIVKEYYNKN